MHYLVTGGAGFIGSHLCESLLDQGHTVSIIDDLSTGSMENIEHLKDHPDFVYYIDTINNQQLLQQTIAAADIIVHLAAAVGVQLVVENPVRTILTNVDGTRLVLQEANRNRKKVLLASTSEVYGKSDKVPFNEHDDLILGPSDKRRWSYACSKALDEFLALAYWQEKQLPVVICRFFNTVGPRQVGRYGMVIPRFIQQALSKQPVTVYGDGSQTRCFTYVKEVCSIIIRLSQHEKAVGEVFNIGSDQEISIEQLAEKVLAKISGNAGMRYVSYSEAYGQGFEDMARRVPDTTKVYKLLGVRPVWSIDQILEEMIAYIASKT